MYCVSFISHSKSRKPSDKHKKTSDAFLLRFLYNYLQKIGNKLEISKKRTKSKQNSLGKLVKVIGFGALLLLSYPLGALANPIPWSPCHGPISRDTGQITRDIDAVLLSYAPAWQGYSPDLLRQEAENIFFQASVRANRLNDIISYRTEELTTAEREPEKKKLSFVTEMKTLSERLRALFDEMKLLAPLIYVPK